MAQTYQELRDQIEKLHAEIKVKIDDFFAQACRSFFEDNPHIESFSWHQYTPYFNDGDECVFSVDYDAFSNSVNGVEGDMVPLDDVAYPGYQAPADVMAEWRLKYEAEKNLKLKDHIEVAKLLQAFTADDMKTLFGDHMRITIEKDLTVRTEAYDHD